MALRTHNQTNKPPEHHFPCYTSAQEVREQSKFTLEIYICAKSNRDAATEYLLSKMYVYILQPYHTLKDFLLCRQMLRKAKGLLQQMKTAKLLSSFGKCCEWFKGEEVT